MRPPSKLRKFAACASLARCDTSSARSKASSLKGTVTLTPLPPAARKLSTVPRKPSGWCQQARILDVLPGLARKRGVDLRRLAVGNRVADDRVAIRHGEAMSSRSLRVNIKVREMLRMSQSLRTAAGKRRERAGKFDCAPGGRVEQPMSGRAVDLDFLHAAVGLDVHGHQQRSVDLAPLGFLREVAGCRPARCAGATCPRIRRKRRPRCAHR